MAKTMDQAVLWFKALGEPHRLALVRRLLGGPRYGAELLEGSGLSQPGLSRHLRILRRAGLVTETPRGRRVFYALAEPVLAEAVLRAVLDGPRDQSITRIEYDEPREEISTGPPPEEFQEWLR